MAAAVKVDGSVIVALKRLRRKLEEGVVRDMRRQEAHIKPSERKRAKARKAGARARRQSMWTPQALR